MRSNFGASRRGTHSRKEREKKHATEPVRVAIHLIDNPKFMAYELAQAAVSGVNLLEVLAAAPNKISHLAVCGTPRRDGHWADDVKVDIDPVRLGAFLTRPGPRRVD